MSLVISKQLVCSTAHVSRAVARLLTVYQNAWLESLGSRSDFVPYANEIFLRQLRENLKITFRGDDYGRIEDFLTRTTTLSGTMDPNCGWRFRVPDSDDPQSEDSLEYFMESIGQLTENHEPEIRDSNGTFYDFNSLLQVLDLARNHDCQYVQFDSDGAEIPNIQKHDW